MNLSYIIDRAATYFADKTALVFGRQAYSYGQLQKSVNRIAAFLVKEGLRPGDLVALYVPNSPEWIVAYYGIIRAGGVALCLNPVYKRLEIEHLLKDSRPRFMMISEKLADQVPDPASIPSLGAIASFESHPVLWRSLDNSHARGAPRGS